MSRHPVLPSRHRWPLLLLSLVACATPANQPPVTPAAIPAPAHPPAHDQKGHHGHGDQATVHHRFDDAAKWSAVFDDPARDAWQKPAQLVEALQLKPGHAVADIGAGTGYFNAYLARAVGATGAVLAVDVEPNLIQHMRARAEKEGTPQVTPILGSFDNPRLPPASVDRLLLVNTYHHIDGRQDYFRRCQAALKPGGQLVVVDFYKKELPIGPGTDHKLAPEVVVQELQAAGYRLVKQDNSLPYQYILIFVPAAAP